MDFLSDKTFLLKLNQFNLKEYWAKINVLDFQTQSIIYEIEGKVVNWSMSISASSSTRSTGSLSLIFDEDVSNILNCDNLISIDKKIALQVGITNPFYKDKIYHQYGDIVWFRQGVFIITEAHSSLGNNSITLNINFIDKSGFLNGVCGGMLPASTSFSDAITIDKSGNEITTYPLIYDIIKETVHHWGNEHYSKIMVEDVDLVGRQIVKYVGTKPICFATDPVTGEKLNNGGFIIDNYDNINFQDKYFKGDIVGYLETPLTFPGELICGAGENVATGVLDKIKTTLGNYEWFYDKDGNFHFRKQKNYLYTGATPLNLTPQDDQKLNSYYSPVFSDVTNLNEFSDSSLIFSANFNPNYANIKNDFVIWGTKDEEKLVRYHLAIDERPKDSPSALCRQDIWQVIDIDSKQWIRYQIKNERPLNAGEQYGEQVAPPLQVCFYGNSQYYFNWREELYRKALLAKGSSTRGSYYDEQLLEEWRKIYDPLSTIASYQENSFEQQWIDSVGTKWYGYNKDVIKNPKEISYWLDLIDNQSTIGKFSVQRIGRRSIVQENNNIDCVYNNEINDIVFIENHYTPQTREQYIDKIKYYNSIGQQYALIKSDQLNLLQTVSQGASCYEVIRDLLYHNLFYNNGVSISCAPIFYLEVNQIIRLNLKQLNIVGDFIINSISWNLNNSPTMSINLTEAITIV